MKPLECSIDGATSEVTCGSPGEVTDWSTNKVTVKSTGGCTSRSSSDYIDGHSQVSIVWSVTRGWPQMDIIR